MGGRATAPLGLRPPGAVRDLAWRLRSRTLGGVLGGVRSGGVIAQDEYAVKPLTPLSLDNQ